ncbi:MAG: aspartate--tRNA(Asn) ligase [Planctomycetota bacterium]|nr:aspartate--tRNA(Asn) ligase [Planctomycetota bacterium]
MQPRALSTELPGLVGQQVFLQGWVHRIRDFGGVRFVILRDRTGFAQVVVPANINIDAIGCEWTVSVTGCCRAETRAPAGVEVLADNVSPISPAETPPLEVFSPSAAEKNRMETLLDHRAISLRIPDVLDVFRVQGVVLDAFRTYLREQGFMEIVTPKLALAGAEGGSAVFRVEYYEGTAYLAQSPQFYKQIMVGSGIERVFESGHAYRAEKSETSRHLTEYLSLDFEMGFIESEQDVMRMHTGLVRAIFEAVKQHCGPIIQRRGVAIPKVGEIPQVSFPRAKQVLHDRFGKTSGIDGDLDTEGERLICQWAQEELGSELLFITGYHVGNRPAYIMPDQDEPPLTRSFDLLFRGVEITTGGQRIHDYRQLVDSFRSRGLNPSAYEGYLECFKHGMCPHGGMGMGIERLIMQMLSLSNIKKACLFPRDRNRLLP